jgi:site-specific DNA recombinase
MANPEFFKPAFDALAVNGCIGDPKGKSAYAYIRVSSDGQAEEGRSGLPRQIVHVHETACRHGYKVPWELVFADDYTGFEFEGRPQLTLLRRELKTPSRRADAVVMEHLDRLSRNADWHQGYLEHEMMSFGVFPIFWNEIDNRILRAVMGAVAQEGMEQTKRRMMEGNLHKARSGRVTARTPSYGYKFVDANGNEGPTAKRETYYAVHQDEEWVVRLMYRRVINGDTMRGIADYLASAGVPPPKNSKYWEPTQIRLIIKNPVYRGDFYAHRWEHKKVLKPSEDGRTMRTVQCKVERPPEEWIHVPVPPIVSCEDWYAANRMLDQNRKMSRRNAKEPYLLTGLVHCAVCGYTYTGTTHRKNRGKLRETPSRAYRCPHSGLRPRHVIEEVGCTNNQISCKVLDNAVWSIVFDAITQPKVLIAAIDADATSERNLQLQKQIDYLENEIAKKAGDDDKLYRAYMAEAFDEQEFAERRQVLKAEAATINQELQHLYSQVITPEQLEERKREILSFAEQVRTRNVPVDPPFDVKQRMIKAVVDKIVLHVSEGWFTVEGAIPGSFTIESTPVSVAITATR